MIDNYPSSKFSKILQKPFFILLFVVFFGFIYVLNLYYPLYADDFSFTTVYGDNERVDSFVKLLKSQYLFYFDHSGRTIEHSIAQLLLWIGSPWIDIIHTAAYILLILTIYLISNHSTKFNYPLLLVIFLLIWFLQPDFSTTVLNITSGSVYMWGTLINLLFMLPYCNYYLGKKKEDSVFRCILFFSGGIIAGWTQENMAPSMIFFIIVILLLTKKSFLLNKYPKWTLWGLLGSLIGCCLLLIAPGNYVRIKTDPTAAVAQSNPLLNGVYNIVGGFINNGIVIFLIYVTFLILYYFCANQNNKIKYCYLSLLFFVTGFFALTIMLFSPIFPPRAWFGIIIFMIIAISILYANLDFKFLKIRIINIILLISFSSLFFFQYKEAFIDLRQINKTVTERELFIEKEKEQGVYDIILKDKIITQTKFTSISDPLTDSAHWLYPVIVNYYGLKSIKFAEDFSQ